MLDKAFQSASWFYYFFPTSPFFPFLPRSLSISLLHSLYPSLSSI